MKEHTEEEQKRGVFVFDVDQGNFVVADKYDAVKSAKACKNALKTQMVTECSAMEDEAGKEFQEMYDEVLEDCTDDFSVLGGPESVSGIPDGDEELKDSVTLSLIHI